MAKKPKATKAPRLTREEQEARARANRRAERQQRAKQALKMVALAKARGVPLTAGAAMRILEERDRKRRNIRRRCPPSPITGSMERMQKHITAPRGWIVYGSTTGRVISK